MLASASKDGTIKIWDLKTYQEVRTFRDRESSWVCSLAVSLNRKHVVSGDIDGIVRLWCFDTAELLVCFEGHSSEIRWVH